MLILLFIVSKYSTTLNTWIFAPCFITIKRYKSTYYNAYNRTFKFELLIYFPYHTKQKWPALLATLCYGNPQCIGCMWSLVIYALSFCPDKTFVQEVLSKTKLKLSGTNILSKVKKTVFSCQNTFKMNFSSWIWVWGFS